MRTMMFIIIVTLLTMQMAKSDEKYQMCKDKKTWFEVLRASIADTMGHVLMCGTPKGYGNWTYEMYLKGKQDKEWDSFQFTTLEGGMVSEDEIQQARLDLDQRTFRQEFEGTFENYAGSIYYNFHPVESVIEKSIDWTKSLHIGMDFNVSPMSACVSQIEKDRIYIVDEVIIYGSNTDEMCEDCLLYTSPSPRDKRQSRMPSSA